MNRNQYEHLDPFLIKIFDQLTNNGVNEIIESVVKKAELPVIIPIQIYINENTNPQTFCYFVPDWSYWLDFDTIRQDINDEIEKMLSHRHDFEWLEFTWEIPNKEQDWFDIYRTYQDKLLSQHDRIKEKINMIYGQLSTYQIFLKS